MYLDASCGRVGSMVEGTATVDSNIELIKFYSVLI